MQERPQNVPSERRARYVLLGLLLIAWAIRVAWGYSEAINEETINRLPDQREYLSLAQNLLAGKGLQFYDPRFHDVVRAFRTPGYPALIAACGANVRIVLLAQATLDSSTVLAAYLLARALLRSPPRSRFGPIAAATAVAFNPLLIFFSGLLLSETLFTALLTWGMLCLIVGGNAARLSRRKAPRPRAGIFLWLAGGLSLALSGLVRPSALPLPVVMGIAAVFLSRPERENYLENWLREEAYHPRSALGQPALWPPKGWPLPVGTTMLLLTMIVIAPWGFRNWRVLGEWVWTTTNEGVTAYDGFNPDATGASDQSFLRDLPQLNRLGELDRSRYLSAKAAGYVRANPARAAQLALYKAGRTWSPVPLSREYGDWKRSALLLAYSAPLYLLVLAGLFGPLSGGLRPAAKVFLTLPAIYFTVVHMMSVGSVRYRAPVEPFLAVIAAAAIAEFARLARAARAAHSPGEEIISSRCGI